MMAGFSLISRLSVMTSDDLSVSAQAQFRPLESEATIELVERYRQGDEHALDDLLDRCLPPLRRWARGRLPTYARSMMETSDLVQDTVMAVLRRIDDIEVRHQGALQAYLRQAVMNRIRDVIRQRDRRPTQTALPDHLQADETSPLDRLLGAERVARYEAAVQRLRDADREVIIGRFELHYSYEELTVVLNKPTVNATRVAVTRAMKRLVHEMRHVGPTPV
jgi:RNA polymerase sigma-70 factor (ECF subfamily)